MITLIEDDKRLEQPNALQVTLPYSQERFGVPPNLYILGTMNTADRFIALLDIALRRRFAFVELMPVPSMLGSVAGVDLRKLLTEIYKRITDKSDREHQIGHSYLMHLKALDDLRFVWYHRIIPLLQASFDHDGSQLQEVLGKGFVEDKSNNGFRDSFKYDLKQDLNDDDFRKALGEIARTIGSEDPPENGC